MWGQAVKRRAAVMGGVLALLLMLAGVAGAAQKESAAVSLDEVVVTASRVQDDIAKVAGDVTVITQAAIANSTAGSVQDLLREEAGVVVRDLYGNGSKSTVDMRGFARGVNTVIMIDGRRLNEIDLSGVDWNLIPLDNVERIEVVRGSGSVLYGDNAMAGVINIITKKGVAAPPTLEVGGWIDSLDFGDFDGFTAHTAVRGGTDRFGYYVYGKYRETDGFRDNTEFRAKDIGGTLSLTLSDALVLDLRGDWHEDEQGYPGGLTAEEMEEDRTQASTPDDGVEYDQYMLGGTMTYLVGSLAEIEMGYTFNNRGFDADISSWGGNIVRDTDTAELKLKGALTLGDNRIVAGVDHYGAEADNSSTFSGYTTKSLVEKDEWGFYAQDDWTVLSALTLTLGYRYSNTDFTADIEDGTGESAQGFGESALKAGVTYTYAPGSKLYVSYSDGYRLPTTDELFAYDGTVVELDPERADTYEVGVRHAFGTLAALGLSLYEMRVSDELYFNPLTYANENIDETRHRGAELSGDLNLADAFTLAGAWSYTKATIESGAYDGMDIPLIPTNKVSLSGAYSYKVARFAMGATWVDERYLDNDLDNEMAPLSDYTTVDMKVTLTDKNAELFFGVDNVFDKAYEEYGVVGFSASEFYPAPGRKYYAGLKMTF